MTKRTIEIRAGEGGGDAQQFVAELAQAYLSFCQKEG